MSQSDYDNALDTSDATLEDAKFEKVLGSLQLAAQDAKDSGDFLSYSTVLDIYFSDPSRYTIEEREELLSHVLAILSEDLDLVYEIGWDLPSLFIPFLDSDYDMSGPIRLVPCAYKVLKLFELLAHDGNPKELFLKCTELLNSIKVTDHVSNNPEVAHKYYDIKVYCIFELIDSCLRRIHTMFPLRFLGMTVTSFINSIYLNPLKSLTEAAFIWKRLYTFARNYTRPPLPEKIDVTPEELAKINEDEDYLQRKLLTGFLTEAINLVLRYLILGFSVAYFNVLLQNLPAESKLANDFVLGIPVLDRLYELALSFDLNLESAFAGFLDSTDELLDFTMESGKLDDDITGELFEKLVVDYQKTFAHSLVDTLANEVTDSLGGSLNLYVYSVASQNQFDKIDISIPQAIAIGLRLVIPGLVHSTFCNRGLHDLSVLCSWIAILSADKRTVEVELAKIPSVILRSYYQAILFTIISSSSDLFFRYITLTLLTKYLSLSPEAVTYDFLMNCLKECPYENVKAALVGVFKELVTKDKIQEDALVDSLNNLSLSKDSPAPPPLPARDTVKKTKYITLTPERLKELFDVIYEYVDLTFVDDESGPTLNLGTVPTLQASLNLLILLKRDLLILQEQVRKLTDVVLDKAGAVDKKWNGDSSQAALLNATGIIKITIDRLKE
ncbi:CIC11C00000004974 [Sungouiella intermedia]|uniref:CIC11C00000004974 n=1 Tax=Sungouiella intermedia TaxID=45354 RepID=A0A1L0DQR5_9ASCO|nr:CIC11C00000004974 [[Candida] intermedia]